MSESIFGKLKIWSSKNSMYNFHESDTLVDNWSYFFDAIVCPLFTAWTQYFDHLQQLCVIVDLKIKKKENAQFEILRELYKGGHMV